MINEHSRGPGRPKGTAKPYAEKKGRIEFLIPNKVIDKFGRSAMKLEMQKYWLEKFNKDERDSDS